MERFVENLMYGTRWILAPIYIGLSLALFMLGLLSFLDWRMTVISSNFVASSEYTNYAIQNFNKKK